MDLAALQAKYSSPHCSAASLLLCMHEVAALQEVQHSTAQPAVHMLTFCLFLASVASLRAKWLCCSHLPVVTHLLASKRSQKSSVCT